ncbi:MAG: cytochrome c3 family protein [Desulfovibrionaceae bacterium]|jgi:hypothetical protein|nr:cytochrome c3 family protein [Desulfovibrionaceae bacterium]
MKKTLFMSLICAAIVCAFGLATLYAADAPADGLKMEATKNPVVFNHSAHKKYDCKECHHTWDGAGAIQKCSDKGCHDNMDKKDKSVHAYYKAMHGKGKLSTCVSCHKDVAKAMDKDAKKALTSCKKSKCHP